MSPALRRIFVDPEYGLVRAGWRMLLMAVALVAATAPIGPLIPILKSIPGFPVQAVGTTLAYLGLTLSTWVMLRFVDKRPFTAVGITFRSAWKKELGQGLLFGSGMMTAIFLIESAAGMVTIQFRVLSTPEIAGIFANSLALYVAVGYGEELMFRGYLFQSFVEGTNKWIATGSMALLFAAAHANNPNASLFGLINVGLAGIWLSIAYFKTRTLWLPIGLHISWNFFQGFVFSYPVSGTTSEKEQIGKAIVTGPDWITGGAFGPEGGALATLMLILGTLLILRWKWVGTSEGVWDLDAWREERKRQLAASAELSAETTPQ